MTRHASGRRPTVAVIESGFFRPASIRVARAFSRAAIANVLLCEWSAFKLSANDVEVVGPAYLLIGDDHIARLSSHQPFSIDSIFFVYAGSKPINKADTDALHRLAAAGLGENLPANRVIDQILLQASARGIATNALGADRSWGPKHQQELRLRLHEKATGSIIPRPETSLPEAAPLATVLAQFSRLGLTCIAKPVFGYGGRGITIVRPGDPPSRGGGLGDVVVQRLMSDPLRINGHKADFRSYLLIDVDNRSASGQAGPILVRRAEAPYQPGHLASEITNTSALVHKGRPPDIHVLSQLESISESLRTTIDTAVNEILRKLVDAYFWTAASKRSHSAHRVILFGVDVLVTMSPEGPHVFFLELNPLPALFRGSDSCDRAVDEMLRLTYLPMLLKTSSEPLAGD